jgi:hypothetical protein
MLILSPLKSIRANGVWGFALGVLFFRGLHWEFVVFGGWCCFWVFIGFVVRCLTGCLLLGCRLGSFVCSRRSALLCVLRGALRFLIYITLLIKKKKKDPKFNTFWVRTIPWSHTSW